MDSITNFYYRYLRYFQTKDDSTATPYDKYMALSYAIRSQMVDKWIATQMRYHAENVRRVYFLSTEYIFGKSLKQNIINLGLEKSVSDAAENLGFSLEELYEQEDDFDLGNGAVGTTAAYFQEAMSSLRLPGMGYGLFYDYGVFRQEVRDGAQLEQPYDWLHRGHPWEIRRPEYACSVGFAGATAQNGINEGPRWTPDDQAIAVPYDFPVPGYGTDTVNTVRFWSAQAPERFLPGYLNHGDYVRACEERQQTGRITRLLLPEQNIFRASEMRIRQQYFLVSASLRDIIRRFKQHNTDITTLDRRIVIQLNGSQCAIAIPEMMRVLVDCEGVPWERAWQLTRKIFAYTSYALSTDNTENWPLYLVEEILPRHTEIIYDINQMVIDAVKAGRSVSDTAIRALSVIEEGEVKWVKMEQLGVLGSSVITGVSKAQTVALKEKLFPELAFSSSSAFLGKTNGVSFRKWLLCANGPLSGLIKEAIGDSWITDHQELVKLEEFVVDEEFLFRLGDIKHASKRRLASMLGSLCDREFTPNALLDVQCAKVHPTRRQVLHLLYILREYLRLKRGEDIGMARTHLFAGKAAPSDFLAKQVIRLIHAVAEVIDSDSAAEEKLQVLFVPDYGVSMAERIIPAADLSEQIGAANYELTGTMSAKFAINGAVTLAGRCGTNLELAECVGEDNIALFGHTRAELEALDDYRSDEFLESHEELSAVFAFLEEVLPSIDHKGTTTPLLASLRDSDSFFVLLEFDDYVAKQEKLGSLARDRLQWLAMSLRNIARIGWFSSDRLVAEYAKDVWKVAG